MTSDATPADRAGRRAAVALAIAVAFGAPASAQEKTAVIPPAPAPADLTGTAQSVASAHVVVTVTHGTRQVPGGESVSGILLNREGFVLTVGDVLADAAQQNAEITIDLAEGEPAFAIIVAYELTQNVGLLKIPARDVALPPFDRHRTGRVGEPVLAYGNPFNLGRSLAVGHITGVDRAVATGAVGAGRIDGLVQLSLPVNPGDQGGPLADQSGVVFAMVHSAYRRAGVMTTVEPQGISFAMPLSRVLPWVDTLIERHAVAGPSDEEIVPRRPWIGVRVEDIEAEVVRKHLRLGAGEGVLVDEVFARSPAQEAGLQIDDVLVTWDDTTILGLQHLGTLLRSTKASTPVTFGIIRAGERQEIRLVIGGRD